MTCHPPEKTLRQGAALTYTSFTNVNDHRVDNSPCKREVSANPEQQ